MLRCWTVFLAGILFALVFFVLCLGPVEGVRVSAEPLVDKTDRYGDPLPDGAVARIGTVRLRHADTVTCLAFSPDGKSLASGSNDGTLRLWDVESGKELRQFGDALDRLSCVAFTPDGKSLVGGNQHPEQRGVTVWDVETGKELRTLPRDDKGAAVLAISQDSTTLAVKSFQAVQLWDLKTGKKLPALDKEFKDGWPTLSFSPDGRVLAVGAGAGAVDLWDWAAARHLRCMGGPDPAPLIPAGKAAEDEERLRQRESDINRNLTLAFSPDGQILWAVHGSGVIRYEAATGKVIGREDLKEERSHEYVAALSPRGDLIAYGDYARIDLRKLPPTQEAIKLTGARSWVKCLAFSPDGKRLASGGVDNKIDIFDVRTRTQLHPFASEPGGSLSVKVLGDGERLALHYTFSNSMFYPGGYVSIVGGRNSAARLWDRHAGRNIPRPFLDTLERDGPHFLPSGDTILVPGVEGLVRLLDAYTGEELRCFGHRGSDFAAWPVAVSPDGRTVVLGSDEGSQDDIRRHPLYRQRLWDVSTGRLLGDIDPPNGGRWSWSPRADRMAVGSWSAQAGEHCVELLDARTGKRLPIVSPTFVRGSFTAFSHGGDLLAVGGQVYENPWSGRSEKEPDQSFIKVWELSTWSVVAEFPKHPGEVRCCFAPGGWLLASGCQDGTIRLLDVLTGKEIRLLRGHRGEINSLDFTPDGKTLVSGSEDGTALVWDVTKYAPARLAPLSERELETLWTDLKIADGAKSYRASASLIRAESPTATFLKTRVRPLKAPAPDLLDRLIADLDSSDFDVRDAATKELTSLERTAVPALNQALDGKPSPEVRKRVEKLLAEVASPTASPERMRDLRALAVLEQIGTAESREILTRVAGGAPEARQTEEAKAALDRAARRTADAP
jgi:WD40 repeat protein